MGVTNSYIKPNPAHAAVRKSHRDWEPGWLAARGHSGTAVHKGLSWAQSNRTASPRDVSLPLSPLVTIHEACNGGREEMLQTVALSLMMPHNFTPALGTDEPKTQTIKTVV